MNVFQREDLVLAPYAMKSKHSRGRKVPEPEHPYRSAYQRDRDRVIHSLAFRRLEYKTQVFVNHEGDDYRTRLTHTLEVSQIARTIARTLELNEDLTEALALAHDLGHTPFGHAGEDVLNDLMKNEGGFNHNVHTLKIVDTLEERYPDFPGLNLTWETREGIVKHKTDFDSALVCQDLEPNSMPTLEAQIVDIADEIAYDNHDLDDGLNSGMIRNEQLEVIPLWQGAKADLDHKHPNLKDPLKRYQIIRSLIGILVSDAIDESRDRLEKNRIKNHEDVKRHPGRLIDFSDGLKAKRVPLKKFLTKELYHHYRVNRMSDKARRFIRQLFEAYYQNTSMLPEIFQAKINPRDPASVRVNVCDYIASMTDRFALDEYEKLFNPYKKV
ncbi:MAG: deoxyguanosinetriphosphate triphosphohydrolase [Candidatus Omnitrophota bacterium]